MEHTSYKVVVLNVQNLLVSRPKIDVFTQSNTTRILFFQATNSTPVGPPPQRQSEADAYVLRTAIPACWRAQNFR